MPRPRIRDVIIPGSVRIRRTVTEEEIMTIRCGACASEFEVHTWNHTTRCRQCGRVCRFGSGEAPSAENVIPLRRRA